MYTRTGETLLWRSQIPFTICPIPCCGQPLEPGCLHRGSGGRSGVQLSRGRPWVCRYMISQEPWGWAPPAALCQEVMLDTGAWGGRHREKWGGHTQSKQRRRALLGHLPANMEAWPHLTPSGAGSWAHCLHPSPQEPEHPPGTEGDLTFAQPHL